MSLFRNLARIIEAPLDILDATVVKPVADIAEAAASAFDQEDES